MKEKALILAFSGLALIALLLIIRSFIRFRLKKKYTRTNKYGFKYQFIQEIAQYYKLRFYDEKSKKWIYVMWSSVDMQWYGTPFDFRVYEKRSFSSENDNSYYINYFKNIQHLLQENENIRLSVEENNKKQNERVNRDKDRKENEGYW